MPKPLNYRIFAATVESVLLYGYEAWTVTKKIDQGLDGCYMRMLRVRIVLNIHRSEHKFNKELYGDIPKLSQKSERGGTVLLATATKPRKFLFQNW